MVLHIQKLEKYVKLETIISLLEKTMIKKVIYYFKHRTEVFIIIIDVYKQYKMIVTYFNLVTGYIN